MVHEVQKVDDSHGGDLCDILPTDAESEALGLQARPMADGARLLDEVVRERFLHLLCPRLFIAPLRHRDDAFEGALIGLRDAFGAGVLEGEKRRAAVFKLYLCLIRQVIIACVHGEAIGFQEGIEQLVEPGLLVVGKWLDRTQTERDRVIGQDAMEIRLQRSAEAHAGGAGAEGIIEGENARLRLWQGNAAVWAGEVGGKDHVLSADDASHHHAIPQLQRGLHRVCQAAHDAVLHDDAVHHHLDGMLLIFRKLDVIG